MESLLDRTMRKSEAFGRSLPFRSPAIAIGHPILGVIGSIVPQRTPKLYKGVPHYLAALDRDLAHMRRDLRGYVRRTEPALLNQLGALTTWDDVVTNRAAGKAYDYMCTKRWTGYSAVGDQRWSCPMLNEGNPPAASLTAAPGGAVMNAASTGAIPLRPPPSGETTLLLNAGIMPDSEESDMIISDILVAVGSVPYSSPWTISSTALTRYTDGVGVFAAVLVTTATTSSQTVRLSSYTGSDNGASQVGQYGRLNTAEYAGMLVPRLQYINYNNGGIMLGMAAGDRGVKSVQNLEWSASAGGACALLLHKPLMYVSSPGAGCLGSLSPPEMLLRCVPLAQESGGSLGFLTAFVSHGYQSADGFAITLQTVSG